MPNKSNRTKVVAVRLPNALCAFVDKVAAKDKENGDPKATPSKVIRKCVEHVESEVRKAHILD